MPVVGTSLLLICSFDASMRDDFNGPVRLGFFALWLRAAGLWFSRRRQSGHTRGACVREILRFRANSSRAERSAGYPRGIDILQPPCGGTGDSDITEGPPHLAEERYPGMNDIEPRHSSSVFLLLA
jgi:hypothetical protein